MRVVVDNSLCNSHTFNGYPYQDCMTWQKMLSIVLGQACITAASSCWAATVQIKPKTLEYTHKNTQTLKYKQALSKRSS